MGGLSLGPSGAWLDGAGASRLVLCDSLDLVRFLSVGLSQRASIELSCASTRKRIVWSCVCVCVCVCAVCAYVCVCAYCTELHY